MTAAEAQRRLRCSCVVNRLAVRERELALQILELLRRYAEHIPVANRNVGVIADFERTNGKDERGPVASCTTGVESYDESLKKLTTRKT